MYNNTRLQKCQRKEFFNHPALKHIMGCVLYCPCYNTPIL